MLIQGASVCLRKSEETSGAEAKRVRATIGRGEVTGGWILSVLVSLYKNNGFYSEKGNRGLVKSQLYYEEIILVDGLRKIRKQVDQAGDVEVMRNGWKWDDIKVGSVGCGDPNEHVRQKGMGEGISGTAIKDT